MPRTASGAGAYADASDFRFLRRDDGASSSAHHDADGADSAAVEETEALARFEALLQETVAKRGDHEMDQLLESDSEDDDDGGDEDEDEDETLGGADDCEGTSGNAAARQAANESSEAVAGGQQSDNEDDDGNDEVKSESETGSVMHWVTPDRLKLAENVPRELMTDVQAKAQHEHEKAVEQQRARLRDEEILSDVDKNKHKRYGAAWYVHPKRWNDLHNTNASEEGEQQQARDEQTLSSRRLPALIGARDD